MVLGSNGAQDIPVPGIFEKGHEIDGGNPVEKP
jgi:hypothetical protein